MQETSNENLPEIQSNRYRVLEVLGSGAVGTVYKAEDLSLRITVAIKKLHKTASDAEAVRFQREGRLAGSLTHPNILTVFDVGFTEKSEPYLVLGYVEGQNLADRLRRPNKIELTEALDIFIQTASGLSHAHQRQVVHRDIKPTNIMLLSNPPTATERVKIVDFGLAKSKLDEQEVTRIGVGLGTPLYMSPEQTEGAELDARSDLYSFGCVMYEVLTGEPPFKGDSVFELMAMKKDVGVLSVENAKYKIPASLEKIINRCLRADRDERYQDALEIRRDLEQVRAEHLSSELRMPGILPEGSVPPEAVSKIEWRPILLVCGLLVCALLPLAGVSFLILQPMEVTETKKIILPSTEERLFDIEATTDGSLMQFLAKQKGRTIRKLTILDSRVTPKGFQQLSGYDVKEVVLEGGSVDRTTLKSLAKVLTLETIRLQRNESIDPDAISELAQMPHLTEFNLLQQEHITKDHIDAISHLQSVNRVVVHHTPCKISGGFKNWKRLPNLEVVMLDYTNVQDSDIAELVAVPRLWRLTMDMTEVSRKAIDTIVRMKNLRVVSFQKVENVTDEDYNRLKKLRPDLLVNKEYRSKSELPRFRALIIATTTNDG